MAKVLCITCSPKPDDLSTSKKLAAAFIEKYREHNPNDYIKIVDLYSFSIPRVDYEVLKAWDNDEVAIAKKGKDVDFLEQICDDFISADKFLISFPNWNLTAPPVLFEYLISVDRVGKTFTYTENGSVGLLKDRKAILLVSSGGVLKEEGIHLRCYAIDWLKGLFALCGIDDVRVILAQGMDEMPEKAPKIVENALKAVIKEAEKF